MAGGRTIGEISRETGVAATTLRYYEQIGLVPEPTRRGGQRRYDDSILSRLEVIALCKSAGFSLDEIQLLFADDAPGRPASRALAEAKLAEIDAQLESLARARAVIEWGMRCTCPSIDACTCGIHTAPPV
ncbi:MULTISPECIES: helix-turn-helix domain-containing protein [Mycobacterium avium complex (MAC)]|uniref:Helix-turn-helix domain-containing protein n=2 Tax=Mycobacterium intracellulare TaxID=1767 RepID=A0AAE4RDG2_MYCIT|nr:MULTISPECIES: helix-turn-helix domain-containing protein [Mycobacterium avium complex (MAC)]AFS15082.1 Mercuric resistance operon regulatory protein [Mycobacterium intracellulare subsp. intracellulare MTCC 9506]MCA2321617.1 helix-turn-helix domain-containing protein [Mycobacterium intracellulare]MCA2339313.1 helix-turn-helix domain-containing protein [Mycobacterium intracellulare]MDV6976440.1 helix-turn-helix domain-containing protein [Mycobacterium intracellulare]MDV6984569.1 helix-turn-he